jgi:serine/threonine-protein kinase
VLLGKYRVESVLGRGGMGVVLRVTHLHLGEELAIKVLMPEGAANPDSSSRFLQEAQAVVRLRGEHVARVTDIGLLPEGLPYMVMEYLQGTDLAGELRRRGTLVPGELVDYALQACEALAEAHAHGIVHRDIKPANLFLTARPDGTPLIKVLDFGISKATLSTNALVTKTDVVMGTVGYMSPEQMKAAKDIDGRTDIWALGVVLYECLTGRRPFEGESFSAVVLTAGTEPPPPMDARIPRGIQSVVLRCLEKDRRARFPTIASLAAALAPFAQDKRAASMVVDRTSRMRQRPGSTSEAVADPGVSPNGATVDLHPRAPIPPTPKAGAGARRALLGGSVAAVTIAFVAVIAQRSGGRAREGALPGDGTASGAPNVVIADHPVDATERAVATMPDAPTPAKDDKAQKLALCTELNAQKKWQELFDCAAGLEALGVADRARELRAKARQETANEALDARVRQALREGDLKDAQALLGQLSTESVYHQPVSEVFDKADLMSTDEARQRAVSYIAAHNCGGLKRYAAQQRARPTGTDRMVALLSSATDKCLGKSSSFSSEPAGGGGSAVPEPPVPKLNCDSANVEDMVTQASNQFSNGYASAALQLVTKALTCKQDVRSYRLAATYACAAHDAASAKLYFEKVPPQFQAAIQQKCQQEHTDLGLSAP